MDATFITATLLAIYVAFWEHSSAASTRNSACKETPTVENCTIVLLKWSFNSESNVCERNYVCRENKNLFDSKEECSKTCPPITGMVPRPKEKDCYYWLHKGNGCYSYWFTWYDDRRGRRRPVMIYTGCQWWRDRLYAYYLHERTCVELRRNRYGSWE